MNIFHPLEIVGNISRTQLQVCDEKLLFQFLLKEFKELFDMEASLVKKQTIKDFLNPTYLSLVFSLYELLPA